MEESGGAGSEQSQLLVLQLNQSQELLTLLLAYLNQPKGGSTDSCKSLASEVLFSIEKAIHMAKSSDVTEQHSSGSQNSLQPFKERERERSRQMTKKRKTQQPKWTRQVVVGSGEGLDGPLDDGYAWRKYGQKDILGAVHPRGYYRCTHRNTRGCPATKQVQRCGENPSAFNVTYCGAHTCEENLQQQQQPELLMSFRTGLRVKTEVVSGSDLLASPSPSPSFFSSEVENYLGGGCSFSPSFVSTATSDSNFTENVVNSAADLDALGLGVGGMYFMLDPVDFDPDFPFDTSTFFS